MSTEAKFSNLTTLLANMIPDTTPATVDSGTPQMLYAELAKSDKLETGVWSATVGGFTIESYSINEIMLMLSGRLRLTDADGNVTELGEGDVFYIPKGWKGRWDTLEDMQKLYVIVY